MIVQAHTRVVIQYKDDEFSFFSKVLTEKIVPSHPRAAYCHLVFRIFLVTL
ncbi:MAG: hypothetical protein E7D33_07765 [Klebsiella sp.]|nr:hypothetical protein [Klebsiella sp.]